MNLINTFTRIKLLFKVRKTPVIRYADLNTHLRRDLGLDNITVDRLKADHRPHQEFVVFGPLTRAP